MKKWDWTQQCSCPAAAERSVTLPKLSPSRGPAGRSALTFREQRPEHGHEDTWVLSMGLRKVILGKLCPAGEVRVKGVEQKQHLPWTHANLENMEVFWGRWDSFHSCLKKKTNKQLFRKIFIGILVTCAAQQRRGALQLVNHTPPCAGCVCKCICNHTPVVFPCMDCLSAFLLGKKSLSVLLSPLKYQSTAPNRI